MREDELPQNLAATLRNLGVGKTAVVLQEQA